LNREAWEQSRQQWGTGELGAGHGAGGTQFLDYRQVAAVFRLTTTGSNPYTGVPQFWKGTTWADMAEDVSPAVPSLYALDKLTTHPVDTIVLAVPSTSGDGWVFQVKGSSAGGGACDPVDQEEVLLVQDVCLDPIPDFTGATGSLDGSEGVVPKPLAGQQNRYLKGNGTWDTITPEDIGAAPDGHAHTLTLGGDLAGTGPVTGSVNATIVNSAITTAKLADNAVTSAKISDLNVTTAKLADGSVTNAKLRNSIGISVIGRALNTTGVPADIQANEANTFLGSNANNNGILFRPIFLAYNESIRTTNLAVSASGYVDAGISVTLVAGTWVVGYHASAELQFSAGSFGQFRCRLFNVTTSAEVANTSARGAGRNDIGFILGACSMHQRLILASTTTIRLEVEFVGLSMTWTTRNLFAGSLIYAMRIG
jgi:hypothetical protein